MPKDTANTPDSTSGDVIASSGATVTAGVRSASGTLEQVTQDTSGGAVTNVALNVQAYEVDEKGDKSGGTISWSADVDILGGGAAADTLTINQKGTITQNNGFTVDEINSSYYEVNPDRAPGNSIYFFGEDETTNIITVPTFTFAPSVISSITINNFSDVRLYVGDIDVTALGSQPEVYLDSPNQGIVNDSSAFNFHIATSEAQPTLVDIEDDNPSQPILELTNINNPIGQTIIKDTSGAVVDYRRDHSDELARRRGRGECRCRHLLPCLRRDGPVPGRQRSEPRAVAQRLGRRQHRSGRARAAA